MTTTLTIRDETSPGELVHEIALEFVSEATTARDLTVPTNKHVLFGHHFTSVAGAAPIVGPAIAVIWGWLPAFLWVVLGTVFAGAVHDFAALWISTRHKGNSIGTLTQFFKVCCYIPNADCCWCSGNGSFRSICIY